jgi:hypothetical protein
MTDHPDLKAEDRALIGLEERRAREAPHIEGTLRAMARNYAGGHRWDFLDSQVAIIAADELTRLRERVAARDEGRRSPGDTGFEGLPGSVPSDRCADAGPCPHSQWCPIETAAPIEGKSILVKTDTNPPVVGEAWWRRENEDAGLDLWWANEGPGDYHADPIRLGSGQVTHWMPMPDADDGGEAVHTGPLSAASAAPQSSSPPPSGEVREAVARLDARIVAERALADSYPMGDTKCARHGGVRDGLKEARAILALIPGRDEAALPEAVETVERYSDAIDASRRIHDWINAIAAADAGKLPSREIRNYTFNEDDGGAVLYFRNNRVAAGGFMVRDLHNFTVSMTVFAPQPATEPPADVVRLVKAGRAANNTTDNLLLPPEALDAFDELEAALEPFASRVPDEPEEGR